jgi:hypothetical protein
MAPDCEAARLSAVALAKAEQREIEARVRGPHREVREQHGTMVGRDAV